MSLGSSCLLTWEFKSGNKWNTELLNKKEPELGDLGNAQSVHILKDNKKCSGKIPKMWLDCH